MSTACPCCASPDTIAYPFDDSLASRMLKEIYPEARRCVDCEYVWWKDPSPRLELNEIPRARRHWTDAQVIVWGCQDTTGSLADTITPLMAPTDPQWSPAQVHRR